MFKSKFKAFGLRVVCMLALVLAMIQTADAAAWQAGSKLYVTVATQWTSDGATFRANFYDGGDTYVPFVRCTEEGADDLTYVLTIPENPGTNWKFERMNPGGTQNWGVAIYGITPPSDGSNQIVFTTTGWPGDNAFNGTLGYWKTFGGAEPEDKWEENSSVKMHIKDEGDLNAETNSKTKISRFVISGREGEIWFNFTIDGNLRGAWTGHTPYPYDLNNGNHKNQASAYAMNDNQGYFKIVCEKDRLYTIYISGTSAYVTDEKAEIIDPVEPEGKELYIRYQEGGSWKNSAFSKGTADGDTFKYSFTIPMMHDDQLGIADRNDSEAWWCMGNVVNGNTISSPSGTTTTWKGGNGNVTITFTCAADGIPQNIKFTGPAYVETPTEEFVIYFDLSTTEGWGNNPTCIWAFIQGGANSCANQTWPGDQMTLVAGTTSIYKWTRPSNRLNPDHVMFNNNNNGKQAPSSGGWTAVNGHVYTADGDSGKDLDDYIAASLGLVTLNVLPSIVASNTDAEWNKLKTTPAVYLLGDILNYNRITPEYEMTRQADGTYRINDVALRDDNIRVAYFNGQYGAKAGVLLGEEDVKPYGEASSWFGESRTPGRACDITFNPATQKITFEVRREDDVTIDGDKMYLPPYMGFVGGDYQQDTTYNTPLTGSTTTDSGWQESWIQYKNGKVVKDLDGNVMYTTRYPINNGRQIYFNVKEKNVEINSDNISFAPMRDAEGVIMVKTGAEWKALLYDDKSTEYQNLFTATGKDENGNEFSTLDDNNYYARYIVHDLWVTGLSKIWTGWTGGPRGESGDEKNQANWDKHIQWGFYGNNDTKLTGDDGYTLQPNMPYLMRDDYSNIKYEGLTYFKSADFFYCVKAGDKKGAESAKNYSIFYTVEAYGAPTIQARAYHNKYGQFNLSVDDLDDITTLITGLRVRRYSATDSGTTEDTWKAVDSEGNLFDNTAEANNYVYMAEFEEPMTEAEFNAIYNDFDGEFNSGGNLADGKFFYSLEIDFISTLGNTITTVVKSNPFTIYHSGSRPSVKVAQLVSAGDDKYVTFVRNNSLSPATCDLTKAQTVTKGDAAWSTETMFYATDVAAADANEAKEAYDNNEWTVYYLLQSAPDSKFAALKDAKVTAWALYRDRTAGSEEVFTQEVNNANLEKVMVPYNADGQSNYRLVCKFTHEVDGQTVNEESETTFSVFPVLPSVKATGTTYSISHEIVNGSDINTGDDNFALGDDAKVRHYTLSADCAYAAPKVLGTTSVPTVKFTSGSLVKSAQVSTDSKVTITGIDPNSNAENLLVANATYPKRNAVYNRGNVWKLNTAANKLYPPAVDGNLAARIYQEEDENGQLINSFVAEVRLAEPKFTHSAMSVCGVNLPENHKTDADYMILHVNGEESLKHHGQINSDSHLLYREEIGGWWDGLIELYTEKIRSMNFTFGGAHVYIFNIGAPTMTLAAAPAAAPARVMARAATDGATHSVVTTQKEIKTFSGQDLPTGVNGVMTDGNVSVTAGEGVINVAANTANVYNVAGALVATGAGNHNVAAGVYVVRADGKTFKVVVR